MSVLEKIRSKTALLVGIVGLALVIFILESLLGSGNVLFHSNDDLVGRIAGDKINYQTFHTKVMEQIAQREQQTKAQVDEATKEQIVEMVWNQMINEKVIKAQYEKVGITVSDDELVDLMLVNPHQYVVQQFMDPNTRQIAPQFARPDGSFDVAKLNQIVANMPADQEVFWKQLEKQIADVRTAEKYNTLIKKAVYVTSAEAKDAFIAQNKQVNAAFVMKRYDAVSDSAVKVTDADLNDYYNKHKNDYKVLEPTRKIDYVSFDVMPSEEDFANLQKDAQRVAEEFRTKTTAAEDSSYISQESEGGAINIANYSKKNMIVPDSTIYTAPKGTVYGPYTEGTFLKVYKLSNIKSIADSGKVRHLLIAYEGAERAQVKRSREQAKKLADSLLTAIKGGGDFTQLVNKFSDDGGKTKPNINFNDPAIQAQLSQILLNVKDTNSWRGNGGNYGWIKADERGMAVEFVQGATEHNKGDIFIKESAFGYHIMEVTDISKSRFNQYSIAQISKLIAPSEKTTQLYLSKASEFAGKNTTAEAFNKSVETDKLNKRIAENVRESDKNLPGLEGAKDLVRWMYRAKKGDVSEVFSFKDRYVVALLTSIKEKGVAPLEEVKDDVTAKVIREKKAEQFINEFNTKAGAAKTIDDVAAKMALQVEKSDNLVFTAYNVASVGREDALIGTATALKAGAMSKAIKGDNGVFVVSAVTVNENPLPKDFKIKQKEMEQMAGSRVDYDLYDALKEKADIEDHRGKFDF